MILFVVFWAAVLNTGAMPLETFRTCASIGLFFFWLNFLNFLRGLLVDFAVFVSGALHVVRSLGPFLLALLITLVAFMVRCRLSSICSLRVRVPSLKNRVSLITSFTSKCSSQSSNKHHTVMALMLRKVS